MAGLATWCDPLANDPNRTYPNRDIGCFDYDLTAYSNHAPAHDREMRAGAPGDVRFSHLRIRSITTGTGRQTVLHTGECCCVYAMRSLSSLSEQSALTFMRMRICS